MGYWFKVAGKVIIVIYGIPALLGLLGFAPEGIFIACVIITSMLISTAYIIEKAYFKYKEEQQYNGNMHH